MICMHMNIKFTTHYAIYHRDVPKDVVVRVILTGERKQIGKDLFRFKSRQGSLYVLCRLDEENQRYLVINAKRKEK